MKNSKVFSVLALCLLIFNFQCDEDEVIYSDCEALVIIDNTAYENSESANYSIVNYEIEGDCLNIEISSSGCDADTWQLSLIDSGSVAESFPLQRYLKLELFNNEACLAVLAKSQSFDLSSLSIEGTTEVVLNIEGFEESINYTY